MKFIPTKEAAENLLNQFISDSLNDYAAKRNFDFGPENRTNVSCLSPYIRHKVLSEKYVIEKVMEINPDIKSKFIQEVLWRTYWKGYLEGRRDIWTDYLESLADCKQQLESNHTLNAVYKSAISAETGIECFDFWVRELIDTGYLHNHARMWFASIWIFTLGLPWQLGADFFYYHLLDADPASNTLSWRWVAGLHTKGKCYFASEDNIKKYTNNRFIHNNLLINYDHALATKIQQPEKTLYKFIKPEFPDNCYPSKNYTLLLHEENMFPELGGSLPDNVIIYLPTHNRHKSLSSLNFAELLMKDCVRGLDSKSKVTVKFVTTTEQIFDYCISMGVTRLHTPFCPTGPLKDMLFRGGLDFNLTHIQITEVADNWEKFLYPLAFKGFFDFYNRVTGLIAEKFRLD